MGHWVEWYGTLGGMVWDTGLEWYGTLGLNGMGHWVEWYETLGVMMHATACIVMCPKVYPLVGRVGV